MRHTAHPTLVEEVMSGTMPMRGRMVHGRTTMGDLYEHAQDYDANGRVWDEFLALHCLSICSNRVMTYRQYMPRIGRV